MPDCQLSSSSGSRNQYWESIAIYSLKFFGRTKGNNNFKHGHFNKFSFQKFLKTFDTVNQNERNHSNSVPNVRPLGF